MPTYARLPITLDRGKGAWVWDTAGKRYFDALSGIAVCNLGHAHPAVAEAICDQAGKLVHTSNIYRVDLQERLADQLCRLSGMDNAFFCNSGAEANEAALKLARKYGHSKGIHSPKVLVMENSFHGRTLFTLSATGNPKVQEGFEPLVDSFIRVPYGNLSSAHEVNDPDIVAILVEPIQGEGGVRIPHEDYFPGLRALCDARGWLLMMDEVQAGVGRTGAWFGFQHSGILPDVMTLAKALGNGIPIGACLACGAAATVLTAGKHGSTFGGNPLACRAALTVLDTILNDQLVQRARELGERILNGFKERLVKNPKVIEIRGKGLMIGIELNLDCSHLVGFALEKGLLINVTAERTVRLLPPLIMSDDEAAHLIASVSELIEEYAAH